MAYRINIDSDVPIYQQLVDEIRSAIKLGALLDGDQLPTVLQLAQELGIARGTIKRAYDELEHLGLVEKVQGRGTFVCYKEPSAESRMDRALCAIDAMLDTLDELGFSKTEVDIYLNLKLREREERKSKVKVGIVECNPETLYYLTEQVRSVDNVEPVSYLLSHVEDYPYNLEEETDLVVTTAPHAEYLQTILSQKKKIARIALRLSPDSMAQIVKLQTGERVGVLGASPRFGQLLYHACLSYTDQVEVDLPPEAEGISDIHAYLSDKTTILIPKGTEKNLDEATVAALEKFSCAGKIITCAYEMDEGSLLFLQERIHRIWEKKNG